jgi:hypothetical protein
MIDFDKLHYTLFPRLRWEIEASQPSGFQKLLWAYALDACNSSDGGAATLERPDLSGALR